MNKMKIYQITEILNRFIRRVNELDTIGNTFFSMEEFRKTISLTAKDIAQALDDYEKKLLHSTYENNEASSFFQTKINSIEQKKIRESEVLKKHLEIEIKETFDELDSIKKINIQSFKDYEQQFIDKQKFLNENKKSNKESYISNVIAINQERILANHKYQETANDLDNRNERTIYEFNHTIERQKQNYDDNLSILNDDFKVKNQDIENLYQEQISNINNKIIGLKRIIVDNTIKLNDAITNHDKEAKTRERYGAIPFDLQTNQLNDEHEEKLNNYDQIEEMILNEFKTQLQEVDNKIQQLRKEQREYEFEAKAQLELAKKAIIPAEIEYLASLDEKIKDLKIQYRKKRDNSIQKQIKKLNYEKNHILKAEKVRRDDEIKRIKDDLLKKQLEYIERFELLRIDKNKYEAIKSNAMKNLNSEKDNYTTNYNAQLQNILENKESYSDIEQCEANKGVLELRLNRDLENTNIEFEINEYEREIKKLDYERKTENEKAFVNRQSKINLLDINLSYQNNVLENRRDFANITKMLEIQKNSIIKEFMTEISYEKIEYELAKYNFYNECDNLQYQMFKVEHDYQNKILDAELQHAVKVSELNRTSVESINKQEEKILINYSFYSECMEHIKFYKERFEIEKKMLDDAQQLFDESIKLIYQLENYFITILATAPLYYFNDNSVIFATLLELLREMKIYVINQLFEHETAIINSRIDFDKGLKYNRVIASLNDEKESFLKSITNRRDKIIETLDNYQSTINLFSTNITNLNTETINLRESISKRNIKKTNLAKIDIINTKKRIEENKIKVVNYEKQIMSINHNIKELMKTKTTIESDISKTTKQYERRLNAIYRSQTVDSRVYNKVINLLQTQFNQLKILVNSYSKYLGVNYFTYDTIPYLITRIINTNSRIFTYAKECIIEHTDTYKNAVIKELASLSENYIKSYERNDNQIYSAKLTEESNRKERLEQLKHKHEAELLLLKKDFENDSSTLANELNKLNNHQLSIQKKHLNKINYLEENHQNELLCHEENFAMYERHYNKKNHHFRQEFQRKVKENKTNLHKTLKNIQLGNENYGKHDISRHTSNIILRKNTIQELKNDYYLHRDKYNDRIKEINKDTRKKQIEFETFIKNNNSNYYDIQKNSRSEFENQLKKIDQKARKRISENQAKYKKDFWKK